MNWKTFILFVLLGISGLIGCQQNGATQSEIPDYALEVLEEVQATGRTFKGYVGGRNFQNREKRLPQKNSNGQKIKYKEWDVHKKVKGKNRGAERLVTGSDGRAYYTNDHYRSFIEIVPTSKSESESKSAQVPTPAPIPEKKSEIPDYTLEVLEKIQTTGQSFKGYVGGKNFQNREKRLPQKNSNGQSINYKTWDVHKKVKGKSRGAERLVTGSDGRAYYTNDNYKSFIEIAPKE